MKNWQLILAMSWLGTNAVQASDLTVLPLALSWNAAPSVVQTWGGEKLEVWDFEGASFEEQQPTLPMVVRRVSVRGWGSASAYIRNGEFEVFEKKASRDDRVLSDELTFGAEVFAERGLHFAVVRFVPIRRNPQTGSWERLVRGELVITYTAATAATFPVRRGGSPSVLSDGVVYKVAVRQTGVHKIDQQFLKDLGVSVEEIDPRRIKIYGNGGGMLPESNATPRISDLEECSIVVAGESDGKFDAADYILFYGEAADKWYFRPSEQEFYMLRHFYSNENHYFIKISDSNGKRVGRRESLNNAAKTVTTFDDYAHYELDASNLLNDFIYTTGSGKEWYGESFKALTNQAFAFNFAHLDPSATAQVEVNVASRTIGSNSSFAFYANEQLLRTTTISSVSSNIEHIYALTATVDEVFAPPLDGNINIRLAYNKGNSDAEGWLNYIGLNVRRQLLMTDGQLRFRDKETLGAGSARFEMGNASGSLTIWDVTHHHQVLEQGFERVGSVAAFGVLADTLREFVAFDGSSFLVPEKVGTTALAPQNLHQLSSPDLLVIYHSAFASEASRFAQHRASHNNLSVATVEVSQIYNEFSSGNQDVTALRDFIKYLYEQGGGLKSVLLFGDGSFDYKNIENNPENNHYIPVYETRNSLDPISSYTTDDFFALLDFNEGGSIASGYPDVAIGRLPVRTQEEARQVVDKIIRYDTDPNALRDWRNMLTFVADDEDGNTHLNDADGIAQAVATKNPTYNVDKIYLDAYTQISIQGGNRYPDANNALNTNIFKGNFIVNYMGHGDDGGWAQERVLRMADINSWNNFYKMPLFITATCSFGPFDEPSKVSAGELLLLKPDGGAVATFTTVRAVYASSNRILTDQVFKQLFDIYDGKTPPTIGEALRKAKTQSNAGIENTRKFTLLGDPSMVLAYPTHRVATVAINEKPVSNQDTIRALQQVTVAGEVQDANGNLLANFNGLVYPTVYDKPADIKTLRNDGGSAVQTFVLQQNILFKGKATVQNGKFAFSFTVPKDINYDFGLGKISYYAENGEMQADATGFYKGIVVGGTDTAAANDDQPPLVAVFMNDDKFVFGGLTSESPYLFVQLADDAGINTTGTGIGHDLTAVLDNNTQSTFVLNDFYEATTDNPRKGSIRYPLNDLSEGRHTIAVKAWDVANNSGTGYTEFVVANDAAGALRHVLNYPNPFTTRTQFQFEHNYAGQPIVVQVQIYTVSGGLVKTIQETRLPEGYRVDDIFWDGLDDFGEQLARGVYLYQITVGAMTNEGNIENSESKFERLVILK